MPVKESFLYQVFWTRFRTNRFAITGVLVVIFLFFSPFLRPI